VITKKEYGADDAQQFVLYAKIDPDSNICYPVLIGTDGSLKITQGFALPIYDTIDITYVPTSSTISIVTYSLGLVTVGTLTLTMTGSNLTRVVKT
jgi:hypothetical protein